MDPVPPPPHVPAPATAAATQPTSSAVVRPAVVYALLFGAQGAYLPYIPIYLASTGLDLGTVGALIALFAAVSLIAAPSWGALADGIGDVRAPVLVAGGPRGRPRPLPAGARAAPSPPPRPAA